VEEDYNGVIYKLDSEDGTILKTLMAPTSSPVGLCWDGEYLWCIDNRADKVIQFSPEDGTTIRSFKAPAADCRGLTFDGKFLWTSDRRHDELYRVNPQTGYVILVTESPGAFPRDLAYDGNSIWHIDYQTDLIYKLSARDDDKYIRMNERKGKVIYTQQIKNFGPGKVKDVDFHLAVPTNRDNQQIEEVSYSIKPMDFVTDNWGQKTAHYKFRNIPAGETRLVEMTTTATTYDVRYFIFPEMVGQLSDIPEEISSKYLENNEKFQYDHPTIQNAVEMVVGDETNPYWMVRKIFNYIIENMYYEMSGGWNTAPTVLERGNGSCSEYTFVFISMCRAVGIPARYVGSVVVRGDDASMDDVFHRWAEVYIPNFGWIPVDGSRGDRDWPRDQAMAIGHMYNTLLITTQSGGGSKTMEWTYNSNVFWTTEPKTYVNFEHFADWELYPE
jgi:transglutaminase-like putative cysteine protease